MGGEYLEFVDYAIRRLTPCHVLVVKLPSVRVGFLRCYELDLLARATPPCRVDHVCDEWNRVRARVHEPGGSCSRSSLVPEATASRGRQVQGLRQTHPMTELAYMVREDWGQYGTAMNQQSAVIRNWLGSPPYVFATADRKKYESDHSADREFMEYVAHDSDDRQFIDLSDLNELRRADKKLTRPLAVLHPYKERDCELLREVVASGSVGRLFVVVWSPRDLVRTWLDGVGAVNLHTGCALGAPDAVQFEAAKCWVGEQYNGLSGGNGKAAVVQLLRLYTAAGYPLDADTWLRAFFAAGGEFDEATKVAKLIKEMQGGTQHRVQTRYQSNILSVLRERANKTV